MKKKCIDRALPIFTPQFQSTLRFLDFQLTFSTLRLDPLDLRLVERKNNIQLDNKGLFQMKLWQEYNSYKLTPSFRTTQIFSVLPTVTAPFCSEFEQSYCVVEEGIVPSIQNETSYWKPFIMIKIE